MRWRRHSILELPPCQRLKLTTYMMKRDDRPVKAGVVIKKDETFLLVQERASRAYGLWNVPSGDVEAGHPVAETAIREAKEETGLDVRLEQDLGEYETGFPDRSIIHLYLASANNGVVSFPATELLDARWFSLDDVEAMKETLVAEYVLRAISSVL